jgi:hypothetical protein
VAGYVEPDIAIVFDKRDCLLKCFYTTAWNETLCNGDGKDCFGIYKVLKNFKGLQEDSGVQVQKMYPCLLIRQRE